VASAILLLPAIGATASTTTTTTTTTTTPGSITTLPDTITVSPDPQAAGKVAARALNEAPLPAGATRGALTIPLFDGIGREALNGLVDVERGYHLRSTLNLGAFLRAHLPHGARLLGPDSTRGTDLTPDMSYQVTLATTNQHVSYDELDYTMGATPASSRELRLDAQVVWEPITDVVLPVSNAVTVTGYGVVSLSSDSSAATSVTLTTAEKSTLSTLIAALPTSGGGVCAESATEFMIATTTAQGATWTATGVGCGNELVVQTGNSTVLLENRGCALDHFITGLFASNEVSGTRAALQSCSD